jgi:hypothetical protein
MPAISEFFGLCVAMYYDDNKQHHVPHVHVTHQSQEAVLSTADGRLLAGKLPRAKMRLIRAWIEIRKAELAENWRRAERHEPLVKIAPLR